MHLAINFVVSFLVSYFSYYFFSKNKTAVLDFTNILFANAEYIIKIALVVSLLTFGFYITFKKR